MNQRTNKSVISSLLRGKGLLAAITFVVLLGMLGVVGFVRQAHVTHADAPVINVPGPITATAGPLDTAIVTYPDPVTVTDGDSDVTLVACTSTNGGVSTFTGGTFLLGTSIVTCTATSADIADDPAITTASFTVTINDLAPTFSGVPSPITVDSTSSAGATVTYGPITASEGDTPPEAITPTCTPASGSLFPIGTTTVSCTATDSDTTISDGPITTSSTVTFTVNVVESAPVFSGVPGPITATAGSTDTATVTYGPISASESEVGGGTETVTPTCTSTNGGTATLTGGTFNLGSSTVTCTAADPDGLTSTASFTVTVNDVAPVLSLPPSPVVANATSPAGATVTYSTVTANEPGEPAETINVTCSANTSATSANGFISSGNFPIGDTTVTCTATDPDGTTATGSFVVHVRGAADQINDLITQFGNISVDESTFGAQLRTVLADVKAGRTGRACFELTAITFEVQLLEGHRIPRAQATQLLAALAQIQAVLNCPSNNSYDRE